jgi:hypothetical protein
MDYFFTIFMGLNCCLQIYLVWKAYKINKRKKITDKYYHVTSLIFRYYDKTSITLDLQRWNFFTDKLDQKITECDIPQIIEITNSMMYMYRNDISEFKNTLRIDAIETLLK